MSAKIKDAFDTLLDFKSIGVTKDLTKLSLAEQQSKQAASSSFSQQPPAQQHGPKQDVFWAKTDDAFFNAMLAPPPAASPSPPKQHLPQDTTSSLDDFFASPVVPNATSSARVSQAPLPGSPFGSAPPPVAERWDIFDADHLQDRAAQQGAERLVAPHPTSSPAVSHQTPPREPPSEALTMSNRPSRQPDGPSSPTGEDMDASLARLVDIGFPIDRAMDALERHHGSFEDAVADLLSAGDKRTEQRQRPKDLFGTAQTFGHSILRKAKEAAVTVQREVHHVKQEVGSRGLKETVRAKLDTVRQSVERGRSQSPYDAPSSFSDPVSRHDRFQDGEETVRRPQPALPVLQPTVLFDGLSSSSDSSPTLPPTSTKSIPPPAAPSKRPLPPALPAAVFALFQRYRTEGNEAFRGGQYGDAITAYSYALQQLPDAHPMSFLLLTNRAAAALKTGDNKMVIEDCTTVLDAFKQESSLLQPFATPSASDPLQEEWLRWNSLDIKSKALLRKATALEGLEKYEEALIDYQSLSGTKGLEGALRCRRHLQSAKRPKSPSPQRAAPPPAATSFTPSKIGPELAKLKAKHEAEAADEQARFAVKDEVDALIAKWKGGKDTNLRALLSSLQQILPQDIAVTVPAIQLNELLLPKQVKIRYMKVIARVHPDKVPAGLSIRDQLLAKGVFEGLNSSWEAFKLQNPV